MGEDRDAPFVQHDLDRAVAFFRSICCREIYVFGSAARGEAREDSDLDIAVRGTPADRFCVVYGGLMMRLSRPADMVGLDLQQRFAGRLLEGSDPRRVA